MSLCGQSTSAYGHVLRCESSPPIFMIAVHLAWSTDQRGEAHDASLSLCDPNQRALPSALVLAGA
jgi:hypothetical protein